jgi:hypothetical protein
MNESTLIAGVLSLVVVCIVTLIAIKMDHEKTIESEAIKAGLVQKVVKYDYQAPVVIWVKP